MTDARQLIGRYEIHSEIAAGGMATVHLGRTTGVAGFSRTVAIKRLHPQFAKDPAFVAMFMDEARLAACIQHPNVVQTLDVVMDDGELFLIMDFVDGAPLSDLLSAHGAPLPPAVACGIASDLCAGLHAAHEARDDAGRHLSIVHRDVSPHNVLVGRDGVARVLDFGIAKAASRSTTTQEGQLKGKIPYMAPEQLRGEAVDRRTDVYALGVVLWEMLVGRRLFSADNQGTVVAMVLSGSIERPQTAGAVDGCLDEVTMTALERQPDRRFATALEMSLALERAIVRSGAPRIGEWVHELAGERLARNAEAVRTLCETLSTAPVVTGTAAPIGLDAPPSAVGEELDHEASSAAEPSSAPSRATRSPFVLVSLALLIAVAGIVAGLSLAPRLSADRESTFSSGPPTAPASAGARAARTTPVPSSTAAEPARSSPISSTAPSTSTSSSPSSSSVPPTSVRPRATAKPKGRPGCDPPYEIGKDGVKRFKVRCLQ